MALNRIIERSRAAFLVILLCLSSPAFATSWTVSATANSGPGSLREVAGLAAAGDTLAFSPALYGDSIVLASRITIQKSLTIQGPGSHLLAISGADLTKLFEFYNPAPDTAQINLSGLTLRRGYSPGSGLGSYGGAFVAAIGRMEIEDCVFEGNLGGVRGGAVCYDGSGPLILRNCRFTDNFSLGAGPSGADGGALWCASADFPTLMEQCVFIGNRASRGGAVHLTGDAEMNACRVSDNLATSGGGLYFDFNGIQRLVSCTIDGNEVSGGGVHRGGGIYAGSDHLQLLNSTVFGNRTVGSGAPGFDQGGGIYTDGTCEILLDHCTVTGNSSDREGGGLYTRDSLLIRQCIVAGNSSAVFGPDLYTDLTGFIEFPLSLGYNILGDGSQAAFTPATGDTVGTSANPIDPLLESLALYGGEVPSLRPACGSPTLDRGDPADTLSVDIRGVARPYGGISDIGAHERNEECCEPGLAPTGLASAIGSGGVTLTWDTVPVSLACQVQGAPTGAPPSAANFVVVPGFESTSFNVPGSVLNPATSYLWRVRCACAIGPKVITPFSVTDTFTTPSLREIAAEALNPAVLDPGFPLVRTADEIDLWPNPARSTETLRFSFPEGLGECNWELIDASGRLHGPLSIRRLGPGFAEIEMRGLKAGTYYLQTSCSGAAPVRGRALIVH